MISAKQSTYSLYQATLKSLTSNFLSACGFSICYAWKYYRYYYAVRIACICIDALSSVIGLFFIGSLVNILGGLDAPLSLESLLICYAIFLAVSTIPSIYVPFLEEKVSRKWSRRLRFTAIRIFMFRMCYYTASDPKSYETMQIGEQRGQNIGELLEDILEIISIIIELCIAGIAALFLGVWFFALLAVFFVMNLFRIAYFALHQKRLDRMQVRDYCLMDAHSAILDDIDELHNARNNRNADLQILRRLRRLYDKIDRQELALSRYRNTVSGLMKIFSRSKEFLVFCAVIAMYFSSNNSDQTLALIGVTLTPGAIYIIFNLIDDFDNNIESLSENLGKIWEDALYVSEYQKMLGLKPQVKNADSPVYLLSKANSSNDNAVSFMRQIESVTFKNVSFVWPTTRFGLKGVNCHIKRGEKIAIVGDSGSGKSTFLKLLLRFLDPDQGEILLNEVPLSKIDLRSFKRRVAFVPSKIDIPQIGTIAEYVAMSELKKKPDMERVIEVCKLTGIHDYIMGTYAGYDSHIGSEIRVSELKDPALFDFCEKADEAESQRGVSFSDGQAAKLALAARLYNSDLDILACDEPTRALGVKSEQRIWDILLDKKKDVTLIAITHKDNPALLRRFDKIIFLKDGAFECIGSFDELALTSQTFCQYFGLQPNNGADLFRLEQDMILEGRSSIEKIKNIVFQDVDAEFGKSQLCNFQCRIQLGQRVAIIGENPELQRLIVSMLLRFQDPCTGNMLINNRRYQDYVLPFIRKRIAWLPSAQSIAFYEELEAIVGRDAHSNLLKLARNKSFCDAIGISPFVLDPRGFVDVDMTICEYDGHSLEEHEWYRVVANLLSATRKSITILSAPEMPEFVLKSMDLIIYTEASGEVVTGHFEKIASRYPDILGIEAKSERALDELILEFPFLFTDANILPRNDPF